MRQLMGRGATAIVAGLAVLLPGGEAMAQQLCWQVASSNAPGGPAYVLVNQCTGQTWQLVKVKGTEQNGTLQPNEWAWTWEPINMPAATNP
jgi:hypothetical protein